MKYYFNKYDKNLSKSIFINILTKPIGMVITLLYTPLLLKYLGQEEYGIWVTILSIINWVTNFDLGIGNGLRNQLSEEIAQSDYKGAKHSNSSAYIILSIIISIVFLLGISIGYFIDWNSILNTKLSVDSVLIVSFIFICINFIVTLDKVGYYATQKPEIVSMISILINLFNLIGVYILLNAEVSDRLLAMSYLFGVSTLIVNIIFSISLWKKNPFLIPNFRSFDRSKLRGITSLGIKFFLLQIASLVMFTTDSLIISNLFSPSQVTPYDTAYKIFGIVNSVFSAFIAPFWSKYTEAKALNRYRWIKKSYIMLMIIWVVCSLGLLIIIPMFGTISKIWLNADIDYGKYLILMMSGYYIVLINSTINSTVLNGLGEVNIQLICGVLGAILNIPLSILFAKQCGLGIAGVCLGTIVCLIPGNICMTLQVRKILQTNINLEENNI